MKKGLVSTFLVLTVSAGALAAEFGSRGGPEPVNIDAVAQALQQDPYDMELLISYGTSKGGSAGHLALSIRDKASGDEFVHSANFYADRSEAHARGVYNAELMTRIPKMEYLFRTSSSLGETASFGLDFGEIYKRSVLGIRVYGVPEREKAELEAFFRELNADFQRQATDTRYHSGEVRYGYLDLNCAKTIGSAFRYGAGYAGLEVLNGPYFSWRLLKKALRANIPTEMALKIMREWQARGYAMDVVLYRKYAASSYMDPHDEEPVAFKDLPNRFPSVLSRDFRRESGRYEDYDNLFAAYLFYNLGKYRVSLDPASQRLQLEQLKAPMPYALAEAWAKKHAKTDHLKLQRGLPEPLQGRPVEE
ncbi:hypothetical protein [Uliginosibacterium sp. TH139]|uniref:hypothetical protein n=1 Tax=Uliginosibacterium sp. TH139 TaxID=2067453 RepID=UPI000C796FEB|nr:hypothetical protein [Uliginosibacterium sp. TH139]PLK50121.1 hypothetical protein C0V76_06860 [Uliginosibacterium sp. TH139]